MERVLGVVVYANWLGWLIWVALIVIIRWTGIDVFSLKAEIKFLIVAVIALTIALTVTNGILYSAIEKRYEKESG